MESADDTSNCSSIYTKHWQIRAVSGISCSASILGSALIILSYACFKKLRTRVREILVHLSVADAGVATANLIGIVVYFDRYYTIKCDENGNAYKLIPPHDSYINGLCKTQAFFALYFTLCSILWTISLAVYLYFVLVHHGTRNAKLFLVFAYFFCYGFPLLLSLWPALTNKLGYSPYNSAGWCTVILVDPESPQQRDVFMGVMGYDLWIYLALVLVTVLYLAMKSFLREEVSYLILYTMTVRCRVVLLCKIYGSCVVCKVCCMCKIYKVAIVLYMYISYSNSQQRACMDYACAVINIVSKNKGLCSEGAILESHKCS